MENTFLQDTCSVTTLTTHESQQSTYNLITSIFYLKHQPIVPHSCLVNLIDVTLACEDDNSKLVEVVAVAHVDDENSLV